MTQQFKTKLMGVIGLIANSYESGGQRITYRLLPPATLSEDSDPSKLYLIIYELLSGKRIKNGCGQPSITLEAILSGDQGLVFLITVPQELSESIKDQLLAYLPRLNIAKVGRGNGYSIRPGSYNAAINWLSGPRFMKAELNNVVDTMVADLGQLSRNDLVGWQVVIRPDKTSVIGALARLSLGLVSAPLKLSYTSLRLLAGGGYSLGKQQVVTAADKSLAFNVTSRLLVSAQDLRRVAELKRTFSALAAAYGLKRAKLAGNTKDFIERLPGRSYRTDYRKLSKLYSLPSPGGKWEEAAELSYSTNLGALIHGKIKYDVILGVNEGNSIKTPIKIGLNNSERQKHTLVVGGTGTGKSTLLAQAFIQDMKRGRGAALIDPHGDLAETVMRHIPKARIKDVVYINPLQINRPVAINLLELPENLNSDELEVAKDFISEAVVSIFRKVFSDDDSGGHRIEYILRNTIHTAFSVKGATLFTLLKLLTNDLYRAGVVSGLNDDSLRSFWNGEFTKAGSYQRVKMSAGVTAKLGRFERSVVVKRMLQHSHSSIDFKDILSTNKILICNLSKGGIGEDTSSLIGMVILAKLQLASLQRSLTAKDKRLPFYLYVDEFELFNAPVFSQLISESRKFGVSLTLAEQTTAYQEEKEANILLANVGNIICFRTAAPIDGKRLGPVFSPYLTSSDLSNLDPYSFYLRASGEKIKRPVFGKTLKLPTTNQDSSNRVVSMSNKQFAYPYLGYRS